MKKKLLFVLCAAILLVAGMRYNTASFYTITEVFDGDTIAVTMSGRSEKVRLIGIDTPETKDPRKPVQCFGPESSDYTKKLLAGKRIRLQADPFSTNRDRYNRLLRYAYLEDGTFYNAQLVQKGYARAYTGFPFTYSSNFSAYEKQAQSEKLGLWGACTTEANEDVL